MSGPTCQTQPTRNLNFVVVLRSVSIKSDKIIFDRPITPSELPSVFVELHHVRQGKTLSTFQSMRFASASTHIFNSHHDISLRSNQVKPDDIFIYHCHYEDKTKGKQQFTCEFTAETLLEASKQGLSLTEEHVTFSIQHFPEYRPSIKRVFLLRHGESEWNVFNEKYFSKAGALKSRDHPLTKLGTEQALSFCHRWTRYKADRDYYGDLITPTILEDQHLLESLSQADSKEAYQALNSELREHVEKMDQRVLCRHLHHRFLHADKIMSSPQCRALQTAMLGLNNHPSFEHTKLELNPLIKETKKKIIELDNVGNLIGKSIEFRAKSKLRDTLENGQFVQRIICPIDREMGHIKWWEVVESEDQKNERCDEFMRMIQYCQASDIIVTTHSNFVRHLAKNFLQASEASEITNSTLQIASKCKLRNAACLGLIIDFSSSPAQVIGASTLFDTEFESK